MGVYSPCSRIQKKTACSSNAERLITINKALPDVKKNLIKN